MSFLNFTVNLLCKKTRKVLSFPEIQDRSPIFKKFWAHESITKIKWRFHKKLWLIKKNHFFREIASYKVYKYSFKYYIQRKRRYIQDKFQSAHIVCRQVYQHFNGQFICLYAHLPDKIVLLHFFREINFTKLPAEYF